MSKQKSRSDSYRPIGAFLLLSLAVLFPLAAQAQVTITGSSTQLTTSPLDQIGPYISGNLVCYTDYKNGATMGEVFCHDLSQNIDFQLTTANVVVNQMTSDVSGNIVVYTETSSGNLTAKYCTISYITNPPTCSPTPGPLPGASGDSFAPGIDGSLVAWSDGSSGTLQVFAVDLSVPGSVAKQITQNLVNNNSSSPNVSGRNVVYSTGADANDTVCQVYVTNFDSGATTQITNSATGCNSSTDISGSKVVYQANRDGTQNIYVYDMTTSTETRIALPGLQQNPHISGDWVSFEDVATSGGRISSIRLYHIPSGTVLTAVQASTQLESAFLNDIDGFNVVYTSAAAGNYDIYLFHFTPNFSGPSFSLSPISPITVSVGSTSSPATVTVNSVNNSSPTVNLSVSAPPLGISTSFGFTSVTPTAGGSANSSLTVSAAPFVTPSSFTLTVTGTSGTVSKNTPANVTVVADSTSVTNVIGTLLGAGCINNGGVANALTSKLAAAQADINGANVQAAINVLTALKNQLNAQAGKHIATSCSINGVAFDPVTVLLSDVQGMIDSLRVGMIPDPIIGYVADASGNGIPGVTLSILDSTGTVTLSTATTDITGFYVFATTGVLNIGTNYQLIVTGLPVGFSVATPSADPFGWSGSGMALNFVLN